MPVSHRPKHGPRNAVMTDRVVVLIVLDARGKPHSVHLGLIAATQVAHDIGGRVVAKEVRLP